MSEPFSTHADLAILMALPVSTVVELRKREGWPHVKLGRAIRFTPEQVAEIIASHTITSAPARAPEFEGARPHRPKRNRT